MGKRIAIFVAIIFVALLLLAASCGEMVPAGHRGVYFNFVNGTDTTKSYGEGFQLLWPWNSIIVYDVRLREIKEDMSILASDQLNLTVDVSIQYRLDPEKVQRLHVELGQNYEETTLTPALRNVARDIITQYTSSEAFLKRSEIQLKVREKFFQMLNKYDYFLVENVLIRNIKFPEVVEQAINRKLAEQQEAERMEFVLVKERKEADRKKIEAEGIAQFQKIVTEGVNENLLRWKAIEATLKLSESQNTKVVVIGSGKDGLPIILGQ